MDTFCYRSINWNKSVSVIITILYFLNMVKIVIPSAMSHHKLDQAFAMEPQDQVAIIGSRVILPCRVINRQGILQWTKDDFGLGISRHLSGFDRYSMIGSDEEGDYSLQIYPIILDDEANFQCQVSPGPNGQPGIRTRYAKLTVLVPPESPKILQGSFMRTTEDRLIELECISPNGKPAAEITWIDGLGNVLTRDVEYFKEPSTIDVRRFTARSILKLKTDKKYNNKSITCQAQNSVDKTYRSSSILFEVKYAPIVTLTIIYDSLFYGKVIEFGTVKFVCESDGNPNEFAYKWYLNNDVLGSEHSNELILTNVTRDLQNAVIKCESQNSVGTSADSETLDIAYKPTFSMRPENVEADIGDKVQLLCKIDANPPAEIVWVFDPIDRLNLHPRVVGTDEFLELIASNETAGRYYCKANNGLVDSVEIIAEASIHLKGPPMILSTAQQYSNENAEKYQIECYAISVPKANHITWSFNGNPINFEYDTHFSQFSVYYPNGIKSILTIEENQINYYGQYNCIVINSYGSDAIEIVFSQESKLSIVFATAGLTIVIVICVAIVTISIVFRKIRKKSLPPADLIPKDDNKSLNKSINQNQSKKQSKKYDSIITISPSTVAATANTTMTTTNEQDYLESNSGSYSTTTTLSINKTDCLVGKGSIIHIPTPAVMNINSNRYSENYLSGNNKIGYEGGVVGGGFGVLTNSIGPISINSNQSINGSTSYVDYARDYYTPAMHHQHIVTNDTPHSTQTRIETPTYV